VQCCYVRCLYAAFVFFVLLKYLFDSDCQINFDQEQIKSMTLASSTLHIRIQEYYGDMYVFVLCCFMLWKLMLWVCSQIHLFCF